MSTSRTARSTTSLLLLVCAAVAAGCTKATPAGGPVEPPATVAVPPPEPATVAPSVAPSPSASAAPARLATDVDWVDGRAIKVRGKVSREPWQHMMGHVPGKKPVYFDLEGGHQTVVYTAQPIECAGAAELDGKVLEIRGESKRGGKADETFVEKHLDVTASRCLP